MTASLPIVMLVIVLIRGVTLDGAADGLRYYLRPDISRLADPQASCFQEKHYKEQKYQRLTKVIMS